MSLQDDEEQPPQRRYQAIVREGSDDDSERECESENRPLKKEPFATPPPRKPLGDSRDGRRTCKECHHFKARWSGQTKPAEHECTTAPCKNWETCPTKYLDGKFFTIKFFS